MPASRAAHLQFHTALWGLLARRSGVLVGLGGGVKGNCCPFPCVQGGEAGSCRAFPCKGASYGPWKDMNLKSPMHGERAVSEERSGLSTYQANCKQRLSRNAAELGP